MMMPPGVLAYRGFGTQQRVRLSARVLETRDIKPASQRKTIWQSAYASYQRYATRELPGVAVRLTWGDESWEASSNDEGFVTWDFEPPPASGGWHDVQLCLCEAPETVVEGHVFIIDHTTEYGVISDIDDTVIETNVTHPLRRAHALFLSEARTRLPFEGVSAFYAALHEGIHPDRTNPIFYVSSSPWNLYQHINEFLEIHDIPYGPVLLRDWGISREGFAPNGKHTHKLDKIREVLELTDPLPFLLIGDSGQHDPELYAEVVERYGERIRAVYIRNASRRAGRAEALARIGEAITARGVEFLALSDTVAAARHAAKRGYIRPAEINHVREEQARDAATP